MERSPRRVWVALGAASLLLTTCFVLVLLAIRAHALEAASLRRFLDASDRHSRRARAVEARMSDEMGELVALGMQLASDQRSVGPPAPCWNEEPRYHRAARSSGVRLTRVLPHRTRIANKWRVHPGTLEMLGTWGEVHEMLGELGRSVRPRLVVSGVHLRSRGEPWLGPVPAHTEAVLLVSWHRLHENLLGPAASVERKGIAAFELPRPPKAIPQPRFPHP